MYKKRVFSLGLSILEDTKQHNQYTSLLFYRMKLQKTMSQYPFNHLERHWT